MEPLYILIAISVILDIVAIILISIDELYYVGAEKFIPLLTTLLIPIIGALITIAKLKGDGNNSYRGGSGCDACTYDFFSGGDFSSGGGGDF